MSLQRPIAAGISVILLAACARPSGRVCPHDSPADLCMSQSAECGTLQAVDSCGVTRVVDCGPCSESETCGVDIPNRCACAADSADAQCARAGATCGTIRALNTCGVMREIECGGCEAPALCGVGGIPNVCGCTPQSDAELCALDGRTCGEADVVDVCGVPRHVMCGICDSGAVCVSAAAGGCGCESPDSTCAQLGLECGERIVETSCGAPVGLECGSCGAGEVCGAWGVPNICGCSEDSADALCARAGRECGNGFVTDQCGSYHSVDCGSCPAGTLCGGGGADGRCEVPVCVGDGWCWENPLPQGETLNAIWGTGDETAWAVGPRGTLLGWNGRRWAPAPSPTSAELRGVWGRSAADVWAVGSDVDGTGVIAHFDGVRWGLRTGYQLHSLNGISGNAAGNAWIVGDGGTRLRLTAGEWVQDGSDPADLLAVAVFPDGRATMARDDGLWSWDLNSWSKGPSWYEWSFDWIWGLSASDFWFSGASILCHARGAATPPRCFQPNNAFSAARSFSADGRTTWIMFSEGGPDIQPPASLVIREDANGNRTLISVQSGGPIVRGMWGSRADSMWAAGDNGYLSHFDGRSWNTPNGLELPDLRAAAIVGAAVYAGGTGPAMLRSTGQAWVVLDLPAEVVGFATEFRGISSRLTEAWAIAPAPHSNDDEQLVLRLDKGIWVEVSSRVAANGRAVAATGMGEAWIAGEMGSLTYCTVAACEMVASPTTVPLDSIWGDSPTNIWAGGALGVLLHFDGRRWASMPSPAASTHSIVSIWGSDASNVWALATDSTASSSIYRFDGSRWALEATLTPAYRGLCGTSSSDVWVVGPRGSIARRVGSGWVKSNSGTEHDFYACAAKAGRGVWVVGDGGAILHRAP